MLDLLGRQVASPVQFVAGLRHLPMPAHASSSRSARSGRCAASSPTSSATTATIVNLATNHPKAGDIVSFNQALCGLYAAGLGDGRADAHGDTGRPCRGSPCRSSRPTHAAAAVARRQRTAADDVYVELGHLFADFLDRGRADLRRHSAAPSPSRARRRRGARRHHRRRPRHSPARRASSTTPTSAACSTASSSST